MFGYAIMPLTQLRRLMSMPIEKFNKLWKEMRAEVYAVQEWALANPESNLRKRVLVRSMASFVESSVSSLSEAILEATVPQIPELYCVLSETQFDLSDQGVIKKRIKQYPTVSRWRLLVNVLERTIGDDHWKVNFAEVGFNDLKTLFKVRNRITHPSSTKNMEVSAEEMTQCVLGFTWFVKNYQGICKLPSKTSTL